MRRQLVSGLFQMLCTWLWTSCVASMWTSFFVALGASVTHHGDLDSLGKLAEAVLVLLCMECPFQYLSLREDCCWDVKNSADACLQLLRHGPYKHGSYMITFMLFFFSLEPNFEEWDHISLIRHSSKDNPLWNVPQKKKHYSIHTVQWSWCQH